MRTLEDVNRKYENMMKAHAFVAKGVGLALHPADPDAHFRHIEAAAGRTYAQMMTKTNVGAGTTFGTTWASELADPSAGDAFVDLVRPRTVVDRLEGVVRGRMNTMVPEQTADLIADWVGEGLGVPVAKLALDTLSLPPSKVAVIAAFTRELARFARNTNIIERRLVNGVAQGVDRAFLDPARAAVANVSPASITNGATEINSTGTSASAMETDIADLLEALSDGSPERPYLVLGPSVALHMIQLRSSGERVFPDLGLLGGTVMGVPVLVAAQAGQYVIGIDAGGVVVAEDGAQIKASEHAMIEMTDTPAGNANTPTAGSTAFVSLFQAQAIAVMVERWITWSRRDDAVAYIDLPIGSPS